MIRPLDLEADASPIVELIHEIFPSGVTTVPPVTTSVPPDPGRPAPGCPAPGCPVTAIPG